MLASSEVDPRMIDLEVVDLARSTVLISVAIVVAMMGHLLEAC